VIKVVSLTSGASDATAMADGTGLKPRIRAKLKDPFQDISTQLCSWGLL